MTNTDYLSFLGYQCELYTGFVRNLDRASIGFLTRCPTLKHLQSDFKRSIHANWEFIFEQERKDIFHDFAHEIRAIQPLLW